MNLLKTTIAFVPLILLPLQVTSAEERIYYPSVHGAGFCWDTRSSGDCYNRIEEALQGKIPDLWSRSDRNLVLTMKDGQTTKTYTDGTDEEEWPTFYSLMGLLLQRFWVISAGHYEGGSFIILDRITGQEVPACGPPIVSPSGNYLLSINNGGDAQYTMNCIQIFRITPSGLHEEMKVVPPWGPSEAHWLDERTFRVVPLCSDHRKGPDCGFPIEFFSHEGKWIQN